MIAQYLVNCSPLATHSLVEAVSVIPGGTKLPPPLPADRADRQASTLIVLVGDICRDVPQYHPHPIRSASKSIPEPVITATVTREPSRSSTGMILRGTERGEGQRGYAPVCDHDTPPREKQECAETTELLDFLPLGG